MDNCPYECLTKEEIFQVLNSTNKCMLGVCEEDEPYIVPVNYTWRYENGFYIFCIKSKACGQKICCMKKNNKVCLEFEEKYCSEIRTVVARGKVIDFRNVDCDELVIEIVATCVTGRKYLKKHCGMCGE